jgi:hypothetical protein
VITFIAPVGNQFNQTTAPASSAIKPSANPDWGLFLDIMEGMDFALSSELSAGGGFQGTQGLASDIINAGIGNNGCLRQLLLINGVGN